MDMSKLITKEMKEEEAYKSTLSWKLKELKVELDIRVSSSIPKSNSKNQVKIVSRLLKLARKEAQGRASVKEIEELDLMELLDDYLDNITDAYDVTELWLEGNERTLEEIESLDVTNDNLWSI